MNQPNPIQGENMSDTIQTYTQSAQLSHMTLLEYISPAITCCSCDMELHESHCDLVFVGNGFMEPEYACERCIREFKLIRVPSR